MLQLVCLGSVSLMLSLIIRPPWTVFTQAHLPTFLNSTSFRDHLETFASLGVVGTQKCICNTKYEERDDLQIKETETQGT